MGLARKRLTVLCFYDYSQLYHHGSPFYLINEMLHSRIANYVQTKDRGLIDPSRYRILLNILAQLGYRCYGPPCRFDLNKDHFSRSTAPNPVVSKFLRTPSVSTKLDFKSEPAANRYSNILQGVIPKSFLADSFRSTFNEPRSKLLRQPLILKQKLAQAELIISRFVQTTIQKFKNIFHTWLNHIPSSYRN